ncbi:MAG: hypothetical protein GX815_07690 [Clostridiales bacterium]|nr:hypothetical protein [Clostridiales bacterium]
MAAELYESESNDCDNDGIETKGNMEKKADEDRTIDKTGEEDSVAAVVSNTEEEDIRRFLTMVLENDDELFIRFKNLSSTKVSKEDMKQYRYLIDSTMRRYLGRDDFINYYEANDFIRKMENFLYEDIQMMLDNKCYLDAFELTNYIFVAVGNVAMDDSDGGTGMLADHCYNIWLEILENTDMKAKKSMYEWFTHHLDGSIIDYMEEYIEDILMKEFLEKEFTNSKLDFTKEKAKEYENKPDSWSSSHRSGQWALRHLQLMEDNGMNWIDLENYCKEHWKSSEVRRYYIDGCISKADYEKAIEVLKESLQLDSEYKGLVCKYSKRLKELYLKTGKKEEYRGQLWKLILRDSPGDIEIYRELKSQYLEGEWLEVREKIFSTLPRHAHVERLYKEDRLYERLLQYVQSSTGLSALKEYESILKEEYPAEILKKYTEEVNKMASHTADRKHYKQLVSILKSMQNLTGGKKVVSEIVLHWRMSYGNRPAMMDELSKVN